MEDRLDSGIEDLWGALTDPDRLALWFGEVEGELSHGGEFRVRIALGGPRTGRVEACDPPQRLLVTMHDPEPQPGQPDHTVIEAQLSAEGGVQTRLVWEERGMPVNLLAAYGAGVQIHVEHLADYISGRELRDVRRAGTSSSRPTKHCTSASPLTQTNFAEHQVSRRVTFPNAGPGKNVVHETIKASASD